MSLSDRESSRASSPLPWKEMFLSASSPLAPQIPPSLHASRSSPALRYGSSGLSSLERLHSDHQFEREFKLEPPHQSKEESSQATKSRRTLSSLLSNGKVSFDPSPSTMDAKKSPPSDWGDYSGDESDNRPVCETSVHWSGQASTQTELSERAGTSNQENFQLAVYIAMAHAVLIFIVMVLYGVSRLLECYRKPIQWAVLCSMPLREVHGTIVTFWEGSLSQGLIGTVLAIPFAICRALIGTIMDARLAFLDLLGKAQSRYRRRVGFSTLMEWLVSFAVITVAYEYLGSFIFASVAFLGFSLYAVGTRLGLVPEIRHLEMQANRSILSAEPSHRWRQARSWLGCLFSPFTETYRLFSTRLTGFFLNNLHHLVAVFLMSMMIVGSLVVLILFSYKVGMEGKDAVVALKTHVQKSNYVERVGLKQWIEDNKVPELIDTYTGRAYETLSDQIDVLAAKYQMTELADVGKKYLIGLAQGQINNANISEISAPTIPSHPVFEKLYNTRLRFQEYDFRGVYSELHEAALILLEHFNIPKEELLDKARQVGERWLDVGKHIFAGSSKLFTGCMHLLFSIASSVASGAPEIINFFANAFIFFSVLHYLIASKSGGVMEKVLGMLPLSESTRSRCAIVLDRAVSSVLLATVKAAVFQATFTWLLFHFLKIHFLYMSTLLAFFSALLPIIPSWWSSLPAFAQLAIEGRYIQSVVLVGAHIWVMDSGVSAIQSGIPDHNAYLTGLSIAGGMALFSSAIEGAIMGPLLMTVAIALKNLYSEFVLTTAKKNI